MPVDTTDNYRVAGGTAAPVYVVNTSVPTTGDGGGGGAVTIADGADVTQGAKADAAATTDTGTFSIVALVKRLLAKWTGAVDTTAPLTGRGKMRPVRLTPTLTATPDYIANDSMGGLISITTAIAASGRGTFLHAINVNSVFAPTLRLIFFNANPTASTFTDNAAIVIDFADQEKICGRFELETGAAIDANTYNTDASATASKLPKAMYPFTGTTLYLAVQALGTINAGSAEDLDIELIFYDE